MIVAKRLERVKSAYSSLHSSYTVETSSTSYRIDAVKIEIARRSGVRRYIVQSAYAVNKSQSVEISSLMDQHTRKRLVLITCAELHGIDYDYDYDVIVNAYLTASRAYRT